MRHPFPQHPPQLFLRLLTCGLLIGMFLLGLAFWNPSPFRNLNLQICDLVGTSLVSDDPPLPIILITIDDTSLEQYGQWPWPRYRLATLLEMIHRAGPAAIGMNILFPEKDRSSLREWHRTVGQDLGITLHLDEIPADLLDHDEILARQIRKTGTVLGVDFLTSPSPATARNCSIEPLQTHGIPAHKLTGFPAPKGLLCNTPVLSESSERKGFLNGIIDPDGRIRRVPVVMRYGGKLYPSFSLALVMAATGEHQLRASTDLLGMLHLGTGKFSLGTDNRGNVLLNSRLQTETYSTISAGSILGGGDYRKTLQGGIVIIGLTGTGLGQKSQLLREQLTSLPEVHLRGIQSILNRTRMMRDDAVFPLIEAGWGLVSTLLLAGMIGLLPVPASLAAFLILVCGTIVICPWLLRGSGYLFSPLLPLLGLCSGGGLLYILRYQMTQAQADLRLHQAARQLAASESTLESVLRTLPDIVFRLDPQGRITYISPAISRYDTDPSRLLGDSIFNIVEPDDHARSRFRINERRTGPRATADFEIRLRLQTKDEDLTRHFSLSAEGLYSGTGSDRRFLGTQGIIRDISRRKALETRLQQARKMEVIGNMAAGIAHDLNNILSGIVSYPELLMLELEANDPLRKQLEVIQRSGQDAAAIVQDLLTLARRSIDVSSPCNLNDIINEFLDSPAWQKPLEAATDVRVILDLEHQLPNIGGSPVHLKKLVMNLLLNGLEAMYGGGELRIRTRTIFETSKDPAKATAPRILLQISDQGIGISANDLERIFEPFYSKKQMGSSGSGLGMTIVWTTVKEHGGEIEIQSQEGLGTTISIYFPVTSLQKQSPTGRFDPQEWRGSESILVIDDNPEQRKICSAMLAKLGYEVLTAQSGEEALKTLRHREVDLLILDMVMPEGLDGLETYTLILEFAPGQRAIVATGYSESERMDAIRSLGIRNCLDKPYSFEKLARTVRETLDHPGPNSSF